MSKDSLIPLERKLMIRFENFSWNTKWQSVNARKSIFNPLLQKKFSRQDRQAKAPKILTLVRKRKKPCTRGSHYVHSSTTQKEQGEPLDKFTKSVQLINRLSSNPTHPNGKSQKRKAEKEKNHVEYPELQSQPCKERFHIRYNFQHRWIRLRG